MSGVACRVRLARADLIGAMQRRGEPKNMPLPPPEYFGDNATRLASNKKEFTKRKAHNACFACINQTSSTTMAPQRLWRNELTTSSVSPVPPFPARLPDVQGPGLHPSPHPHPSGRKEVGGSARQPACNHAGAQYSRRYEADAGKRQDRTS